MEAKDKAKDIVNKFFMEKELYDDLTLAQSKTCAIICVDELINDCDASSPFEYLRLKYWNEVKIEINNL